MKFSSTTFLLTLSALLISSGTVVSVASGNSSFQASLSGYYPYSSYYYYSYYPYSYYDYSYYPYSYYGYSYYPYSYYSSFTTYIVTISISGLPAEHSTIIEIDGNEEGTIQGGSSKEFEVSSRESHVFSVSSYISGSEGTRYFVSESIWNLEEVETSYYPVIGGYSYYYYQYSYARQKLEASHTFNYEPEYMLTIDSTKGQSVDKAGWKPMDAVITLTAQEMIKDSDTERKVFKAWNIDGSEVTGSTISLTMNKPYNARAVYEKEYYIEIKSKLGRPQGSGWYREASTATISVDPEVSIMGFWGSLGAKNVFDRWIGIHDGDQFSSTTIITINEAMTVEAMWQVDYSMAYINLAIVLAIILALIIIGIIASGRMNKLPKKDEKSTVIDTLNLRYSKGEISREEYLRMKKDIQKS
ncbi:hypothetical protein [[Eubacterium] cellulosolvens]